MSDAPGPSGAAPPSTTSPVLFALVVGQLGLHAAMAGLRMAIPLQALRLGAGAWTVGVLLALFAAAPVVFALPAGRFADRSGYHRPVLLAATLAATGMACAIASTLVPVPWTWAWLCVASTLTGLAANLGMLTIQRRAGLAARDGTERMRIFSWLGVAPSFANVLGPVASGLMIDLGGFTAAYVLLLMLPALSWVSSRRVPALPSRPGPASAHGQGPSAWSLLRAPGLRQLLFVNWLFSLCWDVHTFAVPILGHERGFNASTIGFILGTFTLAVTAVRLLVPVLAHRLRPSQVLTAAMLGSGLAFGLYPLSTRPLAMAACASLLGLTLGVAQPMIMTTLHHLTPDGRHGESLALRSMAINTSSTLMPLIFGALGSALGAAALFWSVGAGIAGFSWLARKLQSLPAD